MNKKYYGNVVLFLMAALMLPMSLIMNTASIFYTPVTEELNISLAAFGLNLTIVMLVCAFAAPFVFTPLVKMIKMRWLLSAAILLEAACFVMRATSSSLWVFYLSSVLLAVPMGLLCNICIPIVANSWFPNKPGAAIGIMASTQGLGGMFFSAIGGILIGNYGWRNTFLIWAVICVVFVPFTAIFMRNDPSEVGQTVPGGGPVASGAAAGVVPGIDRNHAMRTGMFWICAVILILSSFSANVNAYINPYCQSIGMTSALAGFISAVIQAGVFCNKILLGNIIDKKGLRVGGMFYVATGIICFLLILFSAGNFLPVAVGCFLIGPLYASVNLYGPLLTRYMFGAKDQPAIWAIFVMLFCALGGSAATIWGLILGVIGYAGAFWLVIAILAVLGVLILFVLSQRENYVKKWDVPEGAK